MRSILFLKHDYWVIRDSIRTAGKHDYSLNFQFVPEIEPCFDGPSGIRARGKDGSEFALFTFGGQGKWLARDGWVSECYRERTAAPGVSFAGKTDGNQELVTFLTPDSPKDRIRWIRETEAIGGRAFELGRDDYLDLIMIGNGGLVQTEAVNSNFEWSWVRFDHRNSKITEMVLLLGSRIDCQTKIRLESPQTHAWVVLKHPSNDECEVSADSVDDFSVRITGAKKIRFNGNEIGLPQVADHDASSVDLQLPFATEMTR